MANPVTSVILSLGQHRLLNASQVKELPTLEKRFKDSRLLLQELHRRGWLTSYQAQQLAQGKGNELLLGPYRILDRLGEGAAGQVYKAVHEKQSFLVALKVLRKDVQTDPEVVGRFRREIEAVSQVAHPNIVKAYETGTAGGQLYLAMEYVEGTDLDRLVKQAGPLPPATACAYIRQAALALQHVHERGLVHRDIKPANLLLSKAQGSQALGLVKLLDLGLARLLDPKADSATSNLTIVSGASVTFGTPDYLAPEQALDFHSADIRADVYSLGCTLFYLLTGKPPFAGGTLTEKLMRHQQAEPPSLAQLRPDLSRSLDAILRRMLAKRPADRYQTPGEAARALAELLPSLESAASARRRPGKRLPRPVLVAVPLVLVGLVLLWLLVPFGNREAANASAVVVAGTGTGTGSTVRPPPATARTIVLQGRDHVRDAIIDFNKPDTAFGAVPQDNRLIKNGESSVFLVRFDLEGAGLPASARIGKATLSFYVWDPHNNATTKVCAFPVKTPWREATATWRQPQEGKAWQGGKSFVLGVDAGPPSGHVVVRPDMGSDTVDPPIEYQIDVTAIVQDWVRGTPNYGFAIVPVPDRAIDGGHASRFQVFASEHQRAQYTPKLAMQAGP